MPQNYLISVVVPIYERPSYVQGCLASILKNEYQYFEVLVIDQSRTDTVKTLIMEHFGKDEKIKYVHTNVVGLSHARNLGIKIAEGLLILFTDDDVIVSNGWISAYVNCYNDLIKQSIRPGVLGGPMSGMWEGSKPAWLPDEFASLFGEYNAGTEIKPFPIGDLPFGGNFCLARPCIDDIGDFPEHIGMVGMRTSAGFVRGRVGGEDSHVALRAARRGYELYYVPEASVQHIMSRERSTREYFLRRLFDEGATQMSLFFSSPPVQRENSVGWFGAQRFMSFYRCCGTGEVQI